MGGIRLGRGRLGRRVRGPGWGEGRGLEGLVEQRTRGGSGLESLEVVGSVIECIWERASGLSRCDCPFTHLVGSVENPEGRGAEKLCTHVVGKSR